MTRSEGFLIAQAFSGLKSREATIQRWLGFLNGSHKRKDWAGLHHHLQSKYPLIHAQFSRFDDDGFEIVGQAPFDTWLTNDSPEKVDLASDAQESIEAILSQARRNVHTILHADRVRLAEFWLQELQETTADKLFESVKATDRLRKEQQKVYDDVDRRVLQTAEVIGVTTTGLARKIATLSHVKCKVVICEEAGEVMEPHLISALLPSVEHFIQIGDHQQLRPQINNFHLSLESHQGVDYQLDRSQFERLCVGQPSRPTFPVAHLNIQRRMRPEISSLIRATVYPRLLDHQKTKVLPDVVGMRKNVFWLAHDHIEEAGSKDKHQKSHSNVWEIHMVHALVKHIVRQGVYQSSDIAVLTPYTGQLQRLRAEMRNDFEIVLSDRDQETLARDGFDIGDSSSEDKDENNSNPVSEALEKRQLSELLRIATVDNFQGEEAKIVIVSLVRSNEARKVGFLKTTNRINVLLSRAQHGMYLIGNSDTYANVPMWAQVIGMLQAEDSVSQTLALCCPRHTDTQITVSEPEDFARSSPEGGCQLACERRLAKCGHRCAARCHSESMHRVFACPQACQRLHSPCNHNCQKATCGEDCGLCMVLVDNVQLPCGHTKDGVPCHLTLDVAKINCKVPVKKEVRECKHIVDVPCSRDVTTAKFVCPSSCTEHLPCESKLASQPKLSFTPLWLSIITFQS